MHHYLLKGLNVPLSFLFVCPKSVDNSLTHSQPISSTYAAFALPCHKCLPHSSSTAAYTIFYLIMSNCRVRPKRKTVKTDTKLGTHTHTPKLNFYLISNPHVLINSRGEFNLTACLIGRRICTWRPVEQVRATPTDLTLICLIFCHLNFIWFTFLYLPLTR